MAAVSMCLVFVANYAATLAVLPGCSSQESNAHQSPLPRSDGSSGTEPPVTMGSDASTWTMGDGGTIAMPRISGSRYSGVDGGVPAFASSSQNYQTAPSAANDDDPQSAWVPTQLPAWIAYDLSVVPADLRGSSLVVWNAPHAGTYINATTPSGSEMPTDYTIEISMAGGGTSAPPANAWTQVAAVSNNLRNTVESPIGLNGANWIRMSITGSSDPNQVAIDLDVYSAPNGATDCWMFMGDSITYITLGYAFSDLPQLVNKVKPDRWPAVINAAIGGTSTATAVQAIDTTLNGYVGRYVVLAYGTNDQPAMFQMETLVQKVLAVGKTPVVPLIPWSDSTTIQANGPAINQAIRALYDKYPQIIRGPDLWSAFMNRTDLIPSGDIHPNSAGQEYLRQQWATLMASLP